MTKKLGYSESTAQNRIDAARFAESVPGLLNYLKSGEINLTQVSLLAQSVRQKENESLGPKIPDDKKSELVEKIRGLDSKSSAVVVARDLDLTIKTRERMRYQQDESIVLEITLSKEQIEQLRRIREITSHQVHDANWADVIGLAARFYLEKKDPQIERQIGERDEKRTSSVSAGPLEFSLRRSVPAPLRRKILRRDKSCQWVDSKTRKRCGSTYQLQVDHIRPRWAQGGNEIENLQALCGVHNRLKYAMGR